MGYPESGWRNKVVHVTDNQYFIDIQNKIKVKMSATLDQYKNICGDVLMRYAGKLNDSLKTFFIETLLLYMAIPGKTNFTWSGRYGDHGVQCCPGKSRPCPRTCGFLHRSGVEPRYSQAAPLLPAREKVRAE